MAARRFKFGATVINDRAITKLESPDDVAATELIAFAGMLVQEIKIRIQTEDGDDPSTSDVLGLILSYSDTLKPIGEESGDNE
jgi:hypothetical protein